jgi:hypothetical protein
MVQTDSEEIQLFSITDRPYGETFGAWTAKWWQWIMAMHKEKSPLLDQTGEHWNIDQPSSKVWFLVGNFARKDKSFPHRKIKIPSGRGILIPVLNCVASFLEYPELKTHNELIKHVRDDVNTIVKNELFINAVRYKGARVPSDPEIFSINISKDNSFEIMNSGITDAAADGYWAFLKPGLKGTYKIRFEGSCENGRLNAGASYLLEIF